MECRYEVYLELLKLLGTKDNQSDWIDRLIIFDTDQCIFNVYTCDSELIVLLKLKYGVTTI